MSNENTAVAEKPGIATTEYERAANAGYWGAVGMIMGGVLAVGPGMVEQFFGENHTSVAYIIAGGLLSIASVAYKMFVDLGYIKSRTDVKVSQNIGE